MLSYEGIARNFRLLVAQVAKQLEATRALLARPDPKLVKRIQDAEDYVDTQRSMIENDCFAFMTQAHEQDERKIDVVRALNVITSNLERMADFSVNISRQMSFLKDVTLLARFEHRAYIDELLPAVALIERALFDRDSTLAVRICAAEDRLDRFYHAHIQEIIGRLRATRDVEDLVTILFILHYLERMGDAMLNIGEAIIFAVLGERLKLRQYRVLDDAFSNTPALDQSITDVQLDSIWGTRSGVRVGKVQPRPRGGREARRVLFKEGDPAKLLQEKESLQRWAQVAPGLVPEVVEFQHEESGAALLLQYLDGITFQDIVVNADPATLRRALQRLEQTLRHLWIQTRRPEPVTGGYLAQLVGRIDDVYRLHPDLRRTVVEIGRVRLPCFALLLEQAGTLDDELPAPFSVLIHGDFNLDNIIYDAAADALHFVDVHRSRDMDYVQDVSVFLVSNFRLPVFVPPTRQRLEAVALEFLRFAREFAASQGDKTFEARLAVGLARSFITSTRFELNRRFSGEMHRRARFLLAELLPHRGRPWDAFRVPNSVLFL